MWVDLVMRAGNGKICCIPGAEFSMFLKKIRVVFSATTSRMAIQGSVCAQGSAKQRIVHRELFLFIVQMRILIFHIVMGKCKLRNGEFW